MVGGRNVGSFLDIPHGTKLVSLGGPRKKTVPGSFAAQWCPELASESLVYPAVTAMMMVWKSACGVLQPAHRRLCFAQPPPSAGLPDSEIRPDRALPQTASGQLGPLVTICLGGMSLAELSAVHHQVVEGTRSPEVAALQEIYLESLKNTITRKKLSTAPASGKRWGAESLGRWA